MSCNTAVWHSFSGIMLLINIMLNGMASAQQNPAAMHPSVGDTFIVADVDFEHPIYKTQFASAAALNDWQLEGGWTARLIDGSLILDSKPSADEEHGSKDHLVFWLKKEIPADFLLEFKVRPVNKKRGLNIVFFNARGREGESIFNPSLKKRTGDFNHYIRGDIDCYHISYWAPGRDFTNLRKNFGFHLVGSGEDNIPLSDPDRSTWFRFTNDRIISD